MLLIATALSLALTQTPPPPPLLDAEPAAQPEVFSPPPLVEAPNNFVTAPPLVDSDPTTTTSTSTSASAIATTDGVETSLQKSAEASHVPVLGLGLDVGAPDGAGVSAYLRPFSWLEAEGGVAHNGVSTGLRGGVTILPYDRWFVPTLTLEVGNHPSGDANPVARFFTGNDALNVPQLRNIGYSYETAMLGLELGSREHFAFFMRAGLTRVHATASSTSQTTIVASSGTGSGTAGVGDVNADLTLPAVKLGFAVYFF